jgi:tripartite-type tricarboxylate transporter receptor subunit TctC
MNKSSFTGVWYPSLKLPALSGLALAVAFGVSATANAQQFPIKPVRLLIQFSPGGAPDLIARSLGQKLTESWGQQVVVDSRPGAGGNIALEICARAAPDGYTLAVVSPTIVINPSLYRDINLNPSKDFTAITLAGTLPNILMVHPSLPVRSVKELIALAKARPGQLNYSTSGVGTSTHLAAELFQYLAGIKLVHVTYKGGAPAMTAAVASGGEESSGSAEHHRQRDDSAGISQLYGL